MNSPQLQHQKSKGFTSIGQDRSKLCCNPTSVCNELRLENYDYCSKHILYDSHNKEKHCSYLYPNNKKCRNIVKYDVSRLDARTMLCFEHSRQQQLLKHRATVGRLRQVESNDLMLFKLTHHLDVDSTNHKESEISDVDDDATNSEPFDVQKHVGTIKNVVSKRRKLRRIIDYASDSSTNSEKRTLKNVRPDYEFDQSDYESTDSEEEECLQHLTAATETELLTQTIRKMSKLQAYYLDEINNLNTELRDCRRRYIHDLRKERETHCSIHDQEIETQEERHLYEQFKALALYRRRHGVEAVLHKKYKEKRLQRLDVQQQKQTSNAKCHFAESFGAKCTERALPCTKFCKKHILTDKKQLLFRACGVEKGGVVCQDPVPNIFDDASCLLHLKLPARRHYVQKKHESESEDEEDGSTTMVKLEKVQI